MSTEHVDGERLIERVSALAGKPCWGYTVGAGTGSVVNLFFGGKIPRANPLRNPHVSAAVRENEAELGLYLECAWRIDAAGAVVAGCWDSNEAGGAMPAGLEQLIDQSVVDVEVASPAFDLRLRFANELTLRVFCEQTNADDERDNYSLFSSSEILIVGCRSVVRAEGRG